MNRYLAGAGAIVVALGIGASAHAANDVMKECGAKYQAAKASNTLGGKNWNQFLAACRGGTAAPVAAAIEAALAAIVRAGKVPGMPATSDNVAEIIGRGCRYIYNHVPRLIGAGASHFLAAARR